MPEPAQPKFRACLTAPPKRMKVADPHDDGLVLRFAGVPVMIVKMTAHVVSSKGSQLATSIDDKLCVGDIVFLGESMKERRRGISPAAAEHIHFE